MKVAILGIGIEGQSAYRYYSKFFSEYKVDVFDESIEKSDVVDVIKVDSFLNIDFASFDIIVRSPSVSPVKLKEKIITDKGSQDSFKLFSITDIFFNECSAKIIGVTGTKGKGTTSSFIAEVLRAGEENVHLIGNIGIPALDVLPRVNKDDIVVYELSSFQLWDLKKSPQIAVMTTLEPDHLEVHKNFQEYVEAKLNIIRHQSKGDYLVYDPGNFDSEMKKAIYEIVQKTGAEIIDGSYSQLSSEIREIVQDNMKLPGYYNFQNASLAISTAKILDEGILLDSIRKGLNSFTGLPHRLKFVAEKNGVRYYDNSIATTPGSVIADIKSFKGPKIMIIGGKDKGADYRKIGEVAKNGNVKEIYAIGENRNKVAQQIGEKYQGKITKLSNQKMDEIVEIIGGSAEKDDIVILSPAAASFDMFLDYKDRGKQFVDAVNKLP